jgi:hypothetical protein
MPKYSTHTTATYKKTLLYYDGAQVIRMATSRGTVVLGLLVDDGFLDSYFSVEISQEVYKQYLSERFDLKYVFENPSPKAWYLLPDQIVLGDQFRLSNFRVLPEEHKEKFPERGFFASAHSEPDNIMVVEKRQQVSLVIDGNWKLRDLSKFSRQLEDLYAFFNGLRAFVSDRTSEEAKKDYTDAFVRPWSSGGSYTGFFKSIVSQLSPNDQLEIDSIRYASLGEIRIEAKIDTFEAVTEVLSALAERGPVIKDAYNVLWKVLDENSLLSDGRNFVGRHSDLAESISEKSQTLASEFGAEIYDSLLKLTGSNLVVAAKTLLALYRRADRMNEFYRQGRVQQAPPTAPLS